MQEDTQGPALRPIGAIGTEFSTRSECPLSGPLNPETSVIRLNPEFEDGLAAIEDASHLVILYWFHEADRGQLSRVLCDQEKERGVFASRSPNRPNPVAMSVVRLIKRNGTELIVSGLDCVDGTAVIDIKPYVPMEDCVPEAEIGWTPPGYGIVTEASVKGADEECHCLLSGES